LCSRLVGDATLEPKPAHKERRDPLKLAKYYQSLLDTGKFESRAALARYLGVSRARCPKCFGGSIDEPK
jgi:hypothetical protein